MSEDLIALLAVLGFFLALFLLMGLVMLIDWIGGRIEARREEPRLLVEAETERMQAAIELEEMTIRRLELEIARPSGEDDIDRALRQE